MQVDEILKGLESELDYFILITPFGATLSYWQEYIEELIDDGRGEGIHIY